MTSPLIRPLPRPCHYRNAPESTSTDVWSRRSALTLLSFITIVTLTSMPPEAFQNEEWVWSDLTSWDEALG
jgi:hypothetical protein